MTTIDGNRNRQNGGDDRCHPAEDRPVQPPPVWITLADRIRWLIAARGVDQRTFSEEAGQSDGYVSNFFSRAKKDPNATMNADALAGIAKRWRASPAWLLLGNGMPDDTVVPSALLPTFRKAPNWPAVEAHVRALPSPPSEWAVEIVGSWPAPPSGVAISVGLVLDLARVVERYYPVPALPEVYQPDRESGQRPKFVLPPEEDDPLAETTPRVATFPRAASGKR